MKAALNIVWSKPIYFLLIKSLTLSGAIMDSTNMYAPVLGDFTIFIAFVNRFDPVCNVATDFFAMPKCFYKSSIN